MSESPRAGPTLWGWPVTFFFRFASPRHTKRSSASYSRLMPFWWELPEGRFPVARTSFFCSSVSIKWAQRPLIVRFIQRSMAGEIPHYKISIGVPGAQGISLYFSLRPKLCGARLVALGSWSCASMATTEKPLPWLPTARSRCPIAGIALPSKIKILGSATWCTKRSRNEEHIP